MTATEHHHLFSNISVIHQVSKRWAQRSSYFVLSVCVYVCEGDGKVAVGEILHPV